MSNSLFVGIDAAKKQNVVAFLDAQGYPITKTFSVPNSLPGAQSLEQRIVDAASSNLCDSVLIGTEATSVYDWHIANFLASSKPLSKFNTTVYRFNPKLTRRFKNALADDNKTDSLDAAGIAQRLRFGMLPAPFRPDNPVLPLRQLTRFRFHTVKTIVRESNYLLYLLFLKFSSWSNLKPFSSINTATSFAFLSEFFSPDEIAALSIADICSFIKSAGKNRFNDPVNVAETLKKIAKESYRLSPKLANSVHLAMSLSINTIRHLKLSLKTIDAAIQKEFSAFPNTLQSIKGIGPVYSAGIFAEIADVSLFRSNDSLAKMAGLIWKRSQSGDFEAQEKRLPKSCNKFLRYYLIEASNSLRILNVSFASYYQKKFNEVRKHQHRRALVLTARKLVRLIFALLHKNQLYSPTYNRL